MAPKRAPSLASATNAASTKNPLRTTSIGRNEKSKAPAKSNTTQTSKTFAATMAKKSGSTASLAASKRKASETEQDEPEQLLKRAKITPPPMINSTTKVKSAVKPEKTFKKVVAEPKTAKSTASKRNASDDESNAAPTKRAKTMPAAKKTVEKKNDTTKAKTIDDATKRTVVKKTVVPKKLVEKRAAASKPSKKLPEINQPPTKILHAYVFGEGSQGELGLGAKNEPGRAVIDVKRPRLNAKLEELNIVQVAVGGMHCAALTVDNKIYSWGVNDQGALGRETAQEGKMEDITSSADEDDSDFDDESEDSGLNPSEAEPRQVDPKHFPKGTRFASLHAGDSTTFAVTTSGLVYGWGTFRGNDGILGFNKDSIGKDGKKTQAIPKHIPELKQVKTMAIGTNHALALTQKGKAFVWGAGEQSQLGRRVVARTAAGALVPREFGFQRKIIVDIATGDYFSYAVEKNGTIYAWGHNGYGQTGISIDSNVDDIIPVPTVVESLQGKNIEQIAGGNHHTIARTKDGEVLVWGRLDNLEGGVKVDDMPQGSIIRDKITNRVLATKKPITVPNLKAQHVATGTDTCFVITERGQAYSWGFSTNYQTGLGTSDDVVEATLVDNSAIRGKKLTFAGVGGQFGVLACEKEEVEPPIEGA